MPLSPEAQEAYDILCSNPRARIFHIETYNLGKVAHVKIHQEGLYVGPASIVDELLAEGLIVEAESQTSFWVKDGQSNAQVEPGQILINTSGEVPALIADNKTEYAVIDSEPIPAKRGRKPKAQEQ